MDSEKTVAAAMKLVCITRARGTPAVAFSMILEIIEAACADGKSEGFREGLERAKEIAASFECEDAVHGIAGAISQLSTK